MLNTGRLNQKTMSPDYEFPENKRTVVQFGFYGVNSGKKLSSPDQYFKLIHLLNFNIELTS
jgi:hypothetical protein